MTTAVLNRRFLSLIPYIAVLIGLYALSSAWVAMMSYQAAVFVLVGRRLPWRSLRDGWKPGPAAIVVLGSSLAGAILIAAYPYAAAPSPALAVRLEGVGLSANSFIAFAATYCLINPLMEELFWRGHLGSERRGLVATDAFFSGYHLLVLWKYLEPPWVVVTFLLLLGAAWTWRRLAAWGRGLALPYLSHVTANVSIMAAALWLVR